MNLLESRPVVFTAQSRHLYYARMLVCQHAIEQGAVPLNPFNAFGYFLHDLVPRDDVRCCNNNVLARCDALWVYGPIADGVWAEILYALQLGKPLRFFAAGPHHADFTELSVDSLTFEEGVPAGLDRAEALTSLRHHLGVEGA
ncbi:MAG: hypothetical protein ABIJ09_16510 [Pseudomonadota bacterium]